MDAMHTREWSDREVKAFNALFSQNPYAKRLLNPWPLKAARVYVLRWVTERGVARAEAHFCEGEAVWRAEVFRQGGTSADVERRFIGGGETHAIVDGRQRQGCMCGNCSDSVQNLSAIPKPLKVKMSSARARKLAYATT